MSTIVSSLIGTIFRDPESNTARGFSADFKQLFSLSDKEVQDFLIALPTIRLARMDSKKKEILESFSKSHPNLPILQIEGVFTVLNFFLKQLMDTDLPSDDYKKWSSDLETKNLLARKDRERFECLISSLQEIIKNTISNEVARRKSAQYVSTLFRECLTSVNIRGVSSRIYTPGTPAEEYHPEITDTTSVISVDILVSDRSGEEKIFSFNAEESDIDYLINCLQAAKKELAILKDYLGRK